MRALHTIAVILALAAAPALALSTRAWADAPVELRQDVTVTGPAITLGDLFPDAGDAARVLVARVRPGQMVVLDASRVQILARSNGVDWGNPAGLRRIAVQSREPAPQAAEVRAEARKGPAVLAYLHSLNAGDIVRADDLTWSREAVSGADAPRDPDAVIGMAARRPLREGDPVSLRDVSAPIVVRKDDVIAVSFSQAGLTLTLTGKALGEAAARQTVSVMNPASKKVIQAVAVAPGQAMVGPAADQFMSAARLSSSSLANPSRLALR